MLPIGLRCPKLELLAPGHFTRVFVLYKVYLSTNVVNGVQYRRPQTEGKMVIGAKPEKDMNCGVGS